MRRYMRPPEAAAVLALAGEASVYVDNMVHSAQRGDHEQVDHYALVLEDKAREIQAYIEEMKE